MNEFDSVVERIHKGERFVLRFANALAIDDSGLWLKVYPEDIEGAMIRLVDGKEAPYQEVMKTFGSRPFPVDGQGEDVINFASHVAGRFGERFAGLSESSILGEVDEEQISEMFNDRDFPDLWLITYYGTFTVLLILKRPQNVFDVVESWIVGHDSVIPVTMKSAVERVKDPVLRRLVKDFWNTEQSDQKDRLYERIAVELFPE